MERLTSSLNRLREAGNLRSIPRTPACRMIDLSGNDYLNFMDEAETLEREFLDSFGPKPILFTSAASRLLSTRQDSHFALEEELERAYGRPALLYNSGYHANVGIIGSLAALPGTLFLADKLVHASIIDGLKMAGAEFYRFRPNDIASLRKLVEKHYDGAERLVVVTESVFSMDGDRAPLSELVALKSEFPKLLLYIDEAHAFGVFGHKGLGLSTATEVWPNIDIMVGTFGKAASSYGAFAVCGAEMKQWLVNTSRSFIFSTALPPATVEWSRFMLGKLMEAEKRREALHRISAEFRALLKSLTERSGLEGLQTGESSTQIVPLIVGNSAKALEISRFLREQQILALAIRRPTVPPGTERIRFSLHSGITDRELEEVKEALELVFSRHFL